MRDPGPNDPGSEIAALVDRLNGGDLEALADLFAHYEQRLRRMVDFRLDPRLAGRVSTSDVIQETFIDALKRVRHYFDKPGMPFFVWLRMVAGQRLVELHREHLGAQMRDAGREVTMSMTVAGGPETASFFLASRLAGDLTTPSDAAIRGEAIGQLEAALESMEPIDREVLALRHFEDLSNQEVAEVLGLDKSAASKRYVRALGRLKEAMAKFSGLSDEATRS